jgi:fucose permease
MTGLQAVTALTVSGAFVFGMVLALLGSLKLALSRRLDLGEGRVAVLLSALHLALIPLVLLSGFLIDDWGVRPVFILGSVLLALALLALSARLSYHRAVAAVLVAGAGGAALSSASIVLMPRAFFGVTETAASLNVGMVFVALGALVTPALTDLLLRGLAWRRTLALLAFLALVPALLAALPGQRDLQLARQGGNLGALLEETGIWMAGLVFFFYAPLEASISTWTTTYLADLGHGERRAVWFLSCFWAAFVASRLGAALLEHAGYLGAGGSPWLLVLPALLAAVILGNLSGAVQPGTSLVGLIALGVLLGPVFPTLVGMAFRLPGGQEAHGIAYGILFALGSAGSFVLAPVSGASMRRRNVQAALRIPMLLGLALTAAALLFALLAGQV